MAAEEEQSLSAQVAPPSNQAKDPKILEFQRKIYQKLLDSTRNNPLLYYKDSRSTRFPISEIESPLVAALAVGETVRYIDFGADDDASREILRKRLTSIRSKARELEEERGVRALFVAAGMVTWKAMDGGRDPLAPMFLIPVEIIEDSRARGEWSVRRAEGSEILVNRILRLRGEVPQRVSDLMNAEFEDGVIDDPASAFRRVTAINDTATGTSAIPRCALGIFNFTAMAMIEDLDGAHDVMAANEIVRALAGDTESQSVLVGGFEPSFPVDKLDGIPPVDEPFVLDADPWQAQAIHTILRGADRVAIIDGPPGTGKSQTIANLIAAIIASGKSVLFVAEKRVALQVVQKRLATAGLGHLILDLHAADTKRSQVYAALKTSRERVGEVLPPDASLDATYEQNRRRLNDHVAAMHAKRPAASLSLFELLSLRAKVPALPASLRMAYGAVRGLDQAALAKLRESLGDASRDADQFLGKSALPWTASPLNSSEIGPAMDLILRVAGSALRPLKEFLRRQNLPAQSLHDSVFGSAEIVEAHKILDCLAPEALSLDDSTLILARDTLRSPFKFLLTWLSSSRRAAVQKLEACTRNASTPTAFVSTIQSITALPQSYRQMAQQIDEVPKSTIAEWTDIAGNLRECERYLGLSLPENLSEAIEMLDQHAASTQLAFRAARLREIRAEFSRAGLSPLLEELENSAASAAQWPQMLDALWVEAQVEPMRPELAAFNGRGHDEIVAEFSSLDMRLRSVASKRVERGSASRFVQATTEYRAQAAKLETQLARIRSRKPLRELIRETPDVLPALAPCIMASPLSVSQFLPAAQLYDFVVFDEASQVTPETAVSAFLRGKRVVLAGDERQLPPTEFFGGGGSDEENEDDDSVIEGIESVLAAMRPFAKSLGLRVHYRSRDERLIAFSNHWLYGDELVTFPGCGKDDCGVSHVLAPPGGEIDEASSSAEVRRVVELVLTHAEKRPNESLLVITLGLKHKNRIDIALAEARRLRPDLDAFFSESKAEPFVVKNLERVQGDERDAVILTFGYARTKTGAVSHNFGPINQRGGERRLNVAVTRAKARLTVVSSFRSIDLDRSRLSSDGAILLARYLAYAESGGADLGRDGARPDVPLNDFEHQIKAALENNLGIHCDAQYGVGEFRIDLVVRHPSEPGRYVLAIECDGATYHSTPTARMRDRLRQSILEGLGWKFCRIWSTDWFNDQASEIERIRRAFEAAVEARAEQMTSVSASSKNREPEQRLPERTQQSGGKSARSGAQPIPPRGSIDVYSDQDLLVLLAWIESDGRLRTDAELSRDLLRCCDFKRSGRKITERFATALATYRKKRHAVNQSDTETV